ncbi:MAG: PKD domain-containing protein, partial [Acidobacteriota bacterium]
EHTYGANGTYPLDVCVTNDSGFTACALHDLEITNVAPHFGPQRLKTWTVDNLTGRWGSWQFTEAGQRARQGRSGSYTALVAPFPVMNTRSTGNINQAGSRPNSNWMGFLIGYEPGEYLRDDADYLLLAWRRNNSSSARRGLHLWRVNGRLSNLWNPDGAPEATLLADGNRFADVGHAKGRFYDVTLELTPGRFRAWINDIEELNVSGDFTNLGGSLAMYSGGLYVAEFDRWHVTTAEPSTNADPTTTPFRRSAPFTHFRVEERDDTSTRGPADWRNSNDGDDSTNSAQSRPSFYYSPSDLNGQAVEGYLDDSGHRGLEGFAFGFNPGDTTNPDADYLMLLWSRGTSDGAMPRGLWLYQVRGTPPDLWNLNAHSPQVTKLADGIHYGSSGFPDRNRKVRAHLESDRFRFWIDEELEIDVTGNFTDGRYALFNNGVSGTRYYDWKIDGLALEEGDTLPAFTIGFQDPGLTDTHHSATLAYGDETPVPATLNQGVVTSSVQVPSQVMAEDLEGIEACVTDDDGAIGCGSAIVRVVNVAPTVTVPATQPANGDVGVSFDLAGAAFTDPGLLDTHSATVDWGDGSAASVATIDPVTGTLGASHVYAASGTFTLEICVLDDDGGEGCATSDVVISDGSFATPGDDGSAAASTAPGAQEGAKSGDGGAEIRALETGFESERPAAEGSVDFTRWSVEPFLHLAPETYEPADWRTVPDGSIARQLTRSEPGFLLSESEVWEQRWSGRIRAEGAGTLGLVLGYEPGEASDPEADYLLLTWGAEADGGPRGVSLYRIRGVLSSLNLETAPEATLLGRGVFYRDFGFTRGLEYRVAVAAEADRIRLWVDDHLELEARAPEGDPFLAVERAGGRFGFFVEGLKDVSFRDWSRRPVLEEGEEDAAAWLFTPSDLDGLERGDLGEDLASPSCGAEEVDLSPAAQNLEDRAVLCGERALSGPVVATLEARGLLEPAGEGTFGLLFGVRPGAEVTATGHYLAALWQNRGEKARLALYRTPVWESDPRRGQVVDRSRTLDLAALEAGARSHWRAEYRPDRFRLWVGGQLELEFDALSGASAGSDELLAPGRWGFFATSRLAVEGFEHRTPRPAPGALSQPLRVPIEAGAQAATVEWGDGSPPASLEVRRRGGAVFVELPAHAFEAPGLHFVTLCVSGGQRGDPSCRDLAFDARPLSAGRPRR